MFKRPDYKSYRELWQKSTVVKRGYKRSYDCELEDGTLLLAHFDEKQDTVLLEIKPPVEEEFSILIQGGKFTETKEKKKLVSGYKQYFSTLPDEEILESLKGAFGISRISLGKEEIARSIFERLKPEKKKRKKSSTKVPIRERILLRAKDDLHDSLLGSSLSAVLYFHFFDFTVLGSALLGFAFYFGGIDIFLRERSPLWWKMGIFLLIGSYFFYTGYTRY